MVKVRVAVAVADAEVCIEIRNRGPAIDRLTLERIFVPLQRGADQADKTAGNDGLGLGLYIASDIAKAHHGTIDARSD
ncbi:ATP-binding protein [Paraburkholderia panacisoli]|uniref:ATP-binding protein n=1 Tax=Paraburkholderia panacisoli TaxID=2603818 RepID=UPI003CCC5B77